jgi:KaiC/GvpD/RAD55 family RecA-like ATPase
VVDTKSRIQDVPITGRVKKRTTGIVGLNLLLDGGFPEGTLIMVYGTPVAGVDLAAYQFWKAEEGEEGTYLMNDGDVDIGMIDATEMHPDLYLTQMAGKRIVVDSLSNMLFVVYTGIHQQIDMTRIMRAADVVIEFKTEVHQAEIERTLAVQKIKDAAAPQRLLPFNITDRGIEASTTSRVV